MHGSSDRDNQPLSAPSLGSKAARDKLGASGDVPVGFNVGGGDSGLLWAGDDDDDETQELSTTPSAAALITSTTDVPGADEVVPSDDPKRAWSIEEEEMEATNLEQSLFESILMLPPTVRSKPKPILTLLIFVRHPPPFVFLVLWFDALAARVV